MINHIKDTLGNSCEHDDTRGVKVVEVTPLVARGRLEGRHGHTGEGGGRCAERKRESDERQTK